MSKTALDFPCNICSAQSGEFCKDNRGKTIMAHAIRLRAAKRGALTRGLLANSTERSNRTDRTAAGRAARRKAEQRAASLSLPHTQTASEAPVIAEAEASRTLGEKRPRCSLCWEPGHNKLVCPTKAAR